jgi:predicted TIM-barrel fold metal-dependent hydrolase
VEDFLFRRCVELATTYDLPIKVHLGYLDGNSHPQLGEVFNHVRDITPIVQAYPNATFVLMHIAWPQQEQLLALAKHQPNVIVDLCWTWIAAPAAALDFVKSFLATVPATKLLCFGGDYVTVETVVGHAEIARRGLQRALEEMIQEGWLTTARAIELVPWLMRGNAQRIFPARAGVNTADSTSKTAETQGNCARREQDDALVRP